jgi:hypothetical protein
MVRLTWPSRPRLPGVKVSLCRLSGSWALAYIYLDKHMPSGVH